MASPTSRKEAGRLRPQRSNGGGGGKKVRGGGDETGEGEAAWEARVGDDRTSRRRASGTSRRCGGGVRGTHAKKKEGRDRLRRDGGGVREPRGEKGRGCPGRRRELGEHSDKIEAALLLFIQRLFFLYNTYMYF